MGGGLLVAGLLGGCAGAESGTANPTTAGPTGSAPAHGGPRVPAPLPTAALLSNPCSVIGPEQYSSLGFAGAGRMVAADPPVDAFCKWTSAGNDQNTVSVGALSVNRNGIDDIYAGRDKSAYFESTTVEGYPAVFTETLDQRKDGFCSLWFGVTDELAVRAGAIIPVGPNRSNPCPVAEKVAAAVIRHLKGTA